MEKEKSVGKSNAPSVSYPVCTSFISIHNDLLVTSEENHKYCPLKALAELEDRANSTKGQ